MIVNTITVVGGGTSGWLTAAYLAHNFPEINITIVDKEVGAPVGVGEGTLLNLKPFLDECGFNIDEWFPAVDATYKSSIMFANWEGVGKDVWHPFYKGNRSVSDNIGIHDVWTQVQNYDFKRYAMAHYDASVLHNAVDASSINEYAFHIDCSKLVAFIKSKIINRVTLVNSDVVNVEYVDNNIKDLALKNGLIITSDLFVDCTGFKNILKTPNKKVTLEGRLFCNTAIAGHVPYKDRGNELKPYVTSEAVDHGWVWQIPVVSRIGSGLVFNRDITSIDEAKDYFVSYWDNRINKEDLKVIDWTPFYIEDMWDGNVVRIGLSAGFIEPLESTGVALITAGVAQLSNAINERHYTEDNIKFFNLQMKLYFEDSIDFVSMHYAKSDRTSKFWSRVKETWTPSDRMIHHIDLLTNPNIPVPHAGKFNYVFNGANWSVWLIQLGYPVAKRNTHIPDNIAEEILNKNYIRYEKYRHVSSRHHASEIDRLAEFYKL
jgi:tryptophan halogenase